MFQNVSKVRLSSDSKLLDTQILEYSLYFYSILDIGITTCQSPLHRMSRIIWMAKSYNNRHFDSVKMKSIRRITNLRIRFILESNKYVWRVDLFPFPNGDSNLTGEERNVLLLTSLKMQSFCSFSIEIVTSRDCFITDFLATFDLTCCSNDSLSSPISSFPHNPKIESFAI